MTVCLLVVEERFVVLQIALILIKLGKVKLDLGLCCPTEDKVSKLALEGPTFEPIFSTSDLVTPIVLKHHPTEEVEL